MCGGQGLGGKKCVLTRMITIMNYGGSLDNCNNYELRRLVYCM